MLAPNGVPDQGSSDSTARTHGLPQKVFQFVLPLTGCVLVQRQKLWPTNYLTKHHDGGMTRYAPPEGQQQSFVDERRNLSESGPAVPQEPVQLPPIHEGIEGLDDSLMEESHPAVAGEHDDDDGYEAGDAPAVEPWIEPRSATRPAIQAAASAPRPLRTPLQISLMDDVPHDMRGRDEVMRRRTDGASSASASEPAPRARESSARYVEQDRYSRSRSRLTSEEERKYFAS